VNIYTFLLRMTDTMASQRHYVLGSKAFEVIPNVAYVKADYELDESTYCNSRHLCSRGTGFESRDS
jgi:hypothetical protein